MNKSATNAAKTIEDDTYHASHLYSPVECPIPPCSLAYNIAKPVSSPWIEVLRYMWIPILTFHIFRVQWPQGALRTPETTKECADELQDDTIKYCDKAWGDLELLDFLKEQLGYDLCAAGGSETGNAAEFSAVVTSDLQKRGVRAKCMAIDDYDCNDLAKELTIIFIIATCGQGELPTNCKQMYGDLDLSHKNWRIWNG